MSSASDIIRTREQVYGPRIWLYKGNITAYLRPENIVQLYSLSSKVTFQVGLEVLKNCWKSKILWLKSSHKVVKSYRKWSKSFQKCWKLSWKSRKSIKNYYKRL